jgi:hypothetical protein
MQWVEVLVHDGTDEEARMWEISENLHRADLTALERDEHIAEWVRLADVSDNLSETRREGRPGNSARVAREIGVNRMDASRATKVDSLVPEAKQAARETGLDDNRTALLKAAQSPPERQAEVVREIAAEKARPADGQHQSALMRIWQAASQAARDDFMRSVGYAPIATDMVA